MLIDATSEKPTSVQRTAICLWISAGLALTLTVVQAIGLIETTHVGLAVVTGLITAGLLALVAVKIGAGRGWARWLFAVLYVFGSFAFIVSVLIAPEMFRALPSILQGSSIVQFVLQTVALVLVFTSTSRQWFKAKRVRTAP